MIPILKMEKQRRREFKSLAHIWKVVQRTQKPRTYNARLFSTRQGDLYGRIYLGGK